MPRKNLPTVTPRAQKAYDMRRQGLTWEEIGAKLKVAPETAKNYANQCENAGQDQLKEFRRNLPEMAAPAATAALADAAITERGFDNAKFMELAAQAGLPQKVANGLAARIRAKYSGVLAEVKRMKTEELIDKMHQRLAMALDHLDEYAMANASAKDLGIIISILTEKVMLLGGKPTSIVDFNVNVKLQTLMPAFMAEAARRGITIEASPSARLIEGEGKA